MFRKKKRVSENFNVGNANMEIPSYEIKINGQVPIDYATAINDRQARKEKIEKDFEVKDKITDEVIDDTHDRYEERNNMVLKESADDTKLYKRADKLAREIEKIVDDISKINWEDFTTETDIDTLNRAVEALDGFATAYSYIMDNEDIFESKAEANKIRKEYQELLAKMEAEGKDIEKEKLEGPLHDLAMKYVNATIGIKESKEDICPECGKNPCECELEECDKLEEAGRVTAELKKPRASVKKEDKLYSRDDVWARVYDELSSEVENEGPSGEIYKQVKIPRGKRFVGPYAGPGEDDLTVYAKTMDDLEWAKKVADHFNLDIVMKEDRNKTTNKYYPFYAIIKDVSDAKVTDEEMKDYIDED